MPSATVLGQTIFSHPPTHTACGLTRSGDGNPGTILVRWLGPALQCLIGQLVLVIAPGWTYQRYYWLCNQSLCAPVASPMRWLAPVLAHPCSPSLSSCLPTRHPSPASTTQKSIWDLGSPSSFTFCYPSGNFFYFTGEKPKKKRKQTNRASFSFLVERVAYLRPPLFFFFCTANFLYVCFPTGGLSNLLVFQGSSLTVPILHLRSVRYGGKHQSRTLHTTSDPYPNSLVLGPNTIFFPRPPLLAVWPGIFSPPGLSSLCLLHGRPRRRKKPPCSFSCPVVRKPFPPVSRSSLALPIHNLELGGTTSPRCAHCASTPKPSASGTRVQDCFYRRCLFRPSTPHPCHPGRGQGTGPPHHDLVDHQSVKGADKTSNASYLDMFFFASLMIFSTLKFY